MGLSGPASERMTTRTDKPVKTNAARLLDSLGIVYEVRAYEVDPDDLSAISVARKIGLPAEQVFKTLLTRANPLPGPRETPHFFAVIPGDMELALKKAEPLTGYVRGGVTVMAARTAFPTYADETIELHEVVSVSAGTRGTQLVLAPADYLQATGATLAR